MGAQTVYAIYRHKVAQNAWCWSVHFRRRGKGHSRRFYDWKHGGSVQSLAAAIAWRDKQASKQPLLKMREFHEQKRSNDTSGVPGVHFIRTRAQPDGMAGQDQAADGRKVHKMYSVRKFGAKEAFARAVAARQDLLELLPACCRTLNASWAGSQREVIVNAAR